MLVNESQSIESLAFLVREDPLGQESIDGLLFRGWEREVVPRKFKDRGLGCLRRFGLRIGACPELLPPLSCIARAHGTTEMNSGGMAYVNCIS